MGHTTMGSHLSFLEIVVLVSHLGSLGVAIFLYGAHYLQLGNVHHDTMDNSI